MSSAPSPNPQSDADQLEAAVDQAIAACGGDAREAVKALIVANAYLETDLEKLKAAASMGYARGQLLPSDRKDWYDWDADECLLLGEKRKSASARSTSEFDPKPT
jgi:hypothetical protein